MEGTLGFLLGIYPSGAYEVTCTCGNAGWARDSAGIRNLRVALGRFASLAFPSAMPAGPLHCQFFRLRGLHRPNDRANSKANLHLN